MSTNSDILKKQMISALEASLGIISTACKSVGISRSTHYKWLEEDQNYVTACEEIGESAIDFVEGKLLQRIEGVFTESAEGEVYKTPPSDTAIIFYLKTKGKKRGYIEKTEIKHDIGDNYINFNLNVTEDIGIKRKDNSATEPDSN